MIKELIKELRARTNAGFLDCKKALQASKMSIEKAIVWLKNNSIIKASKKANNIATEGVINIVSDSKKVVIYEINTQTDFVAKNDIFKKLVEEIGVILLENEINKDWKENEQIINLLVKATATIGEKISLRRVEIVFLKENQIAGKYVHVNKKIGSILIANGENIDALRNVSMHVTSMNPKFLNENEIDEKTILKIKSEIIKDCGNSFENKPENVKQKILDGMFRKKLSNLTLIDQEFVMEKMIVKEYLDKNNLEAIKMIRFEVGEGMSKKEENFAKEVSKQMKK